MKKVYFIVALILVGCGKSNSVPSGFISLESNFGASYLNKINTYMNSNVELNIDYYYASDSSVSDFCTKGQGDAKFGCYSSDGFLVMAESYKDSCLTIVHELLHAYFDETEGDLDPNHTHKEFTKIWEICEL